MLAIERRIQEEEIKSMDWMCGPLSDFPLQQSDLERILLGKPGNPVKKAASAVMRWFMKPLKLEYGKGVFPGWDASVKKEEMVFSQRLGLLKMVKLDHISPSMFIPWQSLNGVSSLANGNANNLKHGCGITGWLPFLKLLIEWAVLVVRQKKVLSQVSDSETQKRTVVEQMTRKNSEDDFIPVPKKPKQQSEVNVLSKLSKASVQDRKKAANEVGGVDDDLHLALALSLSKNQEQVRIEKAAKDSEMLKSLVNVEETKKDQKIRSGIKGRLEAFKLSERTEFRFGAQLTSFHRMLVHQEAKQLGLLSKSEGEAPDRKVTVSKPEVIESDHVNIESEEEDSCVGEDVEKVINFNLFLHLICESLVSTFGKILNCNVCIYINISCAG